MTGASGLRVLAMLEAYSVTGSAKAVLEFGKEALKNPDAKNATRLSIVTFSRSDAENSLMAATRTAGIERDVVRERRAFDRNIIPQLQAVVEKLRPDIVWSNSIKSHFLVRYAGLNRAARWVAFHHGYTATDLKMRIYNQLDRWSLPAADMVLTVCRPFARQMEALNIPPSRIRVQHMPVRPFPAVDHSRIESLKREIQAQPDSRILLAVGRLSFEKGHADLLRAFRLLLDSHPVFPVRLILIGDGPERANLEALSRRLGLGNNLTLAGHCDEVNPWYAVGDVFVLPSHSEGSPNVLLEAMAAGIPVVATSVGGVPELATDETDALLVHAGNPAALEAGISRVLEDKALAERLRQAGRQVVERHTPAAYFEAISGIFAHVMAVARRNQV